MPSRRKSPPSAPASTASDESARERLPTPEDVREYWADAAQRTALFLDALLDRGNAYREHLERGTPALLKFEHELVLDGASFERPCNYALLRVIPPKDLPAREDLRPLVVVDPRAGHGPGIGGFKNDSEVGVAMRAGHPVYFVTFRPQPEEGQTLRDVMHAQARFLEEVGARHAACGARPVVVGNCQAGWAMMALDAARPELFGPLMVVGAPLSYWAGASTLNPMRYAGSALGGTWLASLAADLGADRFDGAHLVDNFERLNPANTLWSRYYKLWSEVDSEAPRFLDFERWWGGYFRMTGAEIETIVEDLFVGNRLARGELRDGERAIDLRAIRAPVVVFASHGDNITPVPQALNWIIDTWGDERAIAAAGRTIVYVLHESVGHLGIFVGGEIARKEHDQLVSSLDVIESLPPGLYEMRLQSKDGVDVQRWDCLEPGDYSVHYEHRTMQDILDLNPEGRDEEALFSSIAKVSALNAQWYKACMRPWVRAFAHRGMGDAAGRLHPLRLQRELLSDAAPAAPTIRRLARQARARRVSVRPGNPLLNAQRRVDAAMRANLDRLREQRDAFAVAWARQLYGPAGLGAWFAPDAPDAERARAWASQFIEQTRAQVLEQVEQGGFAQAVCRIVLAGMASIGAFERRSLRLARLLARMPAQGREGVPADIDWTRVLKEQARITAVAPVEALNALESMLPDREARERALALAAAVMMIEPTLDNPRSEIIEFLMGTLGADAQRVIGLARSLTGALETPVPAPLPTTKPATRRTRGTRRKPAAG
jgi:hypothetical protein